MIVTVFFFLLDILLDRSAFRQRECLEKSWVKLKNQRSGIDNHMKAIFR